MGRALGPDSLRDHDGDALPPAGTVLEGRFELVELVGAGGMGAVYRALDLADGHVVALKLLAVAEANGVRRFRREFRAARRLDHPSVVSVHAFFPAARPFFTMEFVPGATLDRWVGPSDAASLNHPDRVERIRSALGQLLEALAYVHAQGYIHRDLKPENLLVTPEGQLKIMDFGVVHGGSSSGSITRGRIVGTLAYMAPEQLEGRPVDSRADLYSVGAILYELLTGEPPFDEGEFGSLARAILQHQPPSPRSLNPGVDPLLATFALTLLSKKPWQRFATARDALGVLEARRHTGRSGPQCPVLYPPQFAGRDGELTAIRDLLTRLPGERAQVLLLSGGPGQGKTRLLAEAAAIACRLGVRVYTVRAPAGEPRPGRALEPLVELVGAALAATGEPARPSAAELLTPPGVRRLLEALGALAPPEGSALLLDDLDGFDGPSVEALAALVREAAGPLGGGPPGRLALLGTCPARTLAPAEPLRRLADLVQRLRLGSMLSLGPLSADETAAMVRSMLGETAVPPALGAWLHAETEGNPYFIEETVRDAVRGGYLVRADGRLTLAWERLGVPPRDELAERDFARLPLAHGVRELVERELAGLDPTARQVLAVAALIGREFHFDLLLDASGLDEDTLIDRVQDLLAVRLLVDPHAAPDVYRFAHEKVREVLLGEPGAEPPRELHRAVARALERVRPELRDEVALAHHHDAAGDGARAVAYLPGAAEKLAAARDHAAAARAWSRYLDLCGRDGAPMPVGRPQARRSLARVLGRDRRLAEARAVLEELLAETAEPGERAELLRELSYLEARRGDLGASVRRACEHLALVRAHGSQPEHARALLVVGHAQNRHGHYAEAEQALVESEAMFRLAGDARGAAEALHSRGTVLCEQGRFGEAAELLQSALAHFRGFADTRQELMALMNLANVHLGRGSLDLAITCYQEALAQAVPLGLDESIAMLHNNLGYAFILAGDYAEAERCLGHCLRHTADGANPTLEAAASLNRAILRRIAGELVGAREDLERARAAIGEAVHATFLIELGLEAARIDREAGRHVSARRAALEALAIARGNRLPWHEAMARVVLAEAVRGPGALEHARRARDLADPMGADLLLAQALAAEARLLEQGGAPGEAQRQREEAARILRAIARRLGARERLFLRTPLSRDILGRVGELVR